MLELRQITKRYRMGNGVNTEVTALRGLSLQVKAGEKVALTGPSGSGKSTALQVAGLIEDPNCGEVWFEGKALHTLSPKEKTLFRRDGLGFVFQHFHLVPVLTALENVVLPALLKRTDPREAHAQAQNLLERIGLGAQANQRAATLSGGQRQRVALARALINRPRLILADEPTANLDAASGEQVIDLLFDLCGQWKAALLLVTHETRLANRADRQILLIDGRLA